MVVVRCFARRQGPNADKEGDAADYADGAVYTGIGCVFEFQSFLAEVEQKTQSQTRGFEVIDFRKTVSKYPASTHSDQRTHRR